MIKAIGFLMVVVSVCVSSYLIGACASDKARMKFIRAETQWIRDRYTEQENEDD